MIPKNRCAEDRERSKEDGGKGVKMNDEKGKDPLRVCLNSLG